MRPTSVIASVARSARAVSPRKAGRALAHAAGVRRGLDPDWIEARLALDGPVPAAARTLVVEGLGGRVAAPAVERAQLVMSQLVSERVLRHVATSGEVTLRLGRRQAGCRLEVETSRAAGREMSGAAGGLELVQSLSDHWGFERTSGGGVRMWAELPSALAEATRAGAAGDVHVVPDERAGTWRVFDPGAAGPLSEHTTETEAEAAARLCARVRGVDWVVVHDRYHRTRRSTVERRPP